MAEEINFSDDEGEVIEVGRKPSQSLTVSNGKLQEVQRGPKGSKLVPAGQVKEPSRLPWPTSLHGGPTTQQERDPSTLAADFGEDWDTLIVGRRRMPGISSVKGTGYERRTQKSSAPGTNGAKNTQLGTKVRKVTITVRIWTAQQRQELREMLAMLFPPKPKKPLAATDGSVRKTGPDDGLLLDFDTTLQTSPLVTNDYQRAERGEGLYVDFGRSVINSPALSTDEAKQRLEAKEAKVAVEVPKPFDVEHPTLRDFKIRALHFDKASLLEPTSTAGEFKMEFDCTDHIPGGGKAKATVGAATGSTNGGWDKIQSAINVTSTPASTNSKP